MTYQPRNKNCVPLTEAMVTNGVTFYVDDVQSDGRAIAWGREGSEIRVVTYYGRFTLCDDHGRFLKRARCQRGESKRRVQTFASKLDAATAQVRRKIETCE